MNAFRSIRWRLQSWHGVMLALALTGFGYTAWRLEWENQLRRIDQELEERVSAVAGATLAVQDQPAADRAPREAPPRDAVRPAPPPPDRFRQDERTENRPAPGDPRPVRPPRDGSPRGDPRPAPPPPDQSLPNERAPERPGPDDRPPRRPPQEPPRQREDRPSPPGPSPDAQLPAREMRFFEGLAGRAFYYVVWGPDGAERTSSASAPSAVPRPEQAAALRGSRWRGTIRERFHLAPQGGVLVGRDVDEDLAAVRRFAWLLVATGGAVFLLGLGGGWWVSSRALRPIADISATAARIAGGDLTQRIRTADASSELGALAGVLNDTFARLHASFTRQAQFTADASHELRTPVAVVLTHTQSALARDRTADEYRESLAACQRAAQRMRGLTESLLTLARIDSGEPTEARVICDLALIARGAIDLLRPLAEAGQVTLIVELSPVRCQAHPGQLEQVVTNLVSNAIHYNRAGGSVRIRTAAEPGAAVLSVQDTGEGIAPVDLPHVFERFYRADKARAGSAGRAGLGLAISKAIVEAHRGTIQAVSAPGAGSTFTVRLPAGTDHVA
jgi:two-component system OmpR family sensor kinase